LADFQREIRKVESGGAGRLRVFLRISALTRRRAEGLRHIPVSTGKHQLKYPVPLCVAKLRSPGSFHWSDTVE